MKRLLSLSLFLMTAMLSFAHSFAVINADGQTIYYEITSSSDLTVAVTYRGTSYYQYDNEYTGVVNIPATVTYNGKTYSVTSIGDHAFYNCSGLKYVTIPNGVTSIGDYAFRECSGLTFVTIPNSVTSIGNYAFYNCRSLTSVTIPNSVTSIGISAFNGCRGLKKVRVTDIAAWCNISFGNFAANPLYYAKHIYSDENTEITDLVIPNSVTSIGSFAFSGCSGLTSVTIPNSVTSIGDYAFYSCRGLTSVTIPNSVTSIGSDAFYYCSGLKSVTIPNSVTSIGSSAFHDCSGLTSLSIPNSVTSIGSSAFYGCSGLTSIEIPSSVTYIGSNAFSGCSGLTSVTINSNSIISKTYSSTFNLSNIFGSQVKSYIIGDGVTSIGISAFNGCSGLTSVTIGNSVTSIGSFAFSGCSGLTSVTIPNSVTSIGDYAFSGCSGLTSIVVEKGNTKYDSRNNCNAIIETASNTLIRGCKTTVTPNSVTAIGSGAFHGCRGLTSVTIPNSVTSIGDYAFYSCRGLTSVTIPNSVTSIGMSAFYKCSGLTSITIPNSVTSIYDEVFSGCSGLKEITSYIQEPFAINDGCWYGVNKSIPLYVPKGSKEKYQGTGGWKDFTNIIEFGGERIEPLTEPQEVDMAAVPNQMDLNGMVVGNTYYVLDADNGDGADSENGCVVINTTTSDEAIDGIAGKDISDASAKAAFKGIIFMVPAGTGTVSINAETLGTSSLMVKIGSQAAQAFQLAERETVEIPYTVAEPTYVYIYAGTGTQAARAVGAARAAAAENSVKVYSYKWEPTAPTGINSVDNSQSATGNEAGDWYTIDGRKLSGKPAQKGIYIVNGRKVAVK